jgi:O-antigen/teichoic acid export membrane protein
VTTPDSAPVGLAPEARLQRDENGAAEHIRGSWLLVAGRLANVGIDFAVQVMLVRYLSTTDYGAFAYALSVVSLTATLAVLGLDRSIGRYVPIYDEQGDPAKVVGAWIVGSLSAFVIGAALAGVVVVLGPTVGGTLVNDDKALAVLLVLVIMTPLTALAAITRQVLATFASPRVILFRSYLLAPLLQLVLVAGVLLTGASVEVLAIGWLVVIVISSAVSTILVIRILGQRGLLRGALRSLDLPIRPLFSFGLPLFGSSLVMQLRISGAVILIQAIRGTTEVALFRAGVPVARQTLILFETFQLLFTPLAARLYARDDRAGLNDAYWQTALWIAVFSFPVFAWAFAFPESLILLFFGERYADMAPTLTILALGFYVNAALGFNSLLLRILGRVRFTVATDLVTMLVGAIMAFPLITAFGATGAAVAVAGTMVAQNVVYQIGMRQESGLRAIDLRYWPVYVALLGATVATGLIGAVAHPSFIGAAVLTAVASLGVFAVSRSHLRIGSIFPELGRVPLLRSLVGL